MGTDRMKVANPPVSRQASRGWKGQALGFKADEGLHFKYACVEEKKKAQATKEPHRGNVRPGNLQMYLHDRTLIKLVAASITF